MIALFRWLLRRDPFPEVIRALAKHRVRYVFIGGYAVYLYGARDPEEVGDVDILIRNDGGNLEQLRKALTDLGVKKWEPPGGWGFWRNPTKFGDIDVHRQVGLKSRGRADYFDLRRHAVRRRVAGRRAWAPSLDDLIAMKELASRSGDLRDIEELERLKKQQ